jgi:RES domain-containing protein
LIVDELRGLEVGGSKHYYIVALSFAGEQREYVQDVADYLRRHGVGVFFDAYELARLAGRDLETELKTIYGTQSSCTVVFVSDAYKRKQWAQLELRCALEASREGQAILVPVRLEDTDLAELPSTISYVNAVELSPPALGRILLETLSTLRPIDTSWTSRLDLWRVARKKHSSSTFIQSGAYYAGGIWSDPGLHVIYAAQSLCGAILEAVANLSGQSSEDFEAVCAELVTSNHIEHLDPVHLPPEWKNKSAAQHLRKFGTKVLMERGADAIISVPSQILPNERVFMLGPRLHRSTLVLKKTVLLDLSQFAAQSESE